MVNPFQYTRTAERIEAISNELIEISRTVFDAVAGTREVESDFAHILDGANRSGHDLAMIDAELNKRRREFEKQLEQRATALVEELLPLEGIIAQGFDEQRPKRNISNPTEVMLSRERWEAVSDRLDAGQGLGEVVAGADLPTVLAIEYFAPGYLLKFKRPDQDEDSVRQDVKVLVIKRLSEVAHDDARALIDTARRAQGHAAIAWVWAKGLQRRFDGDPLFSNMASAVEAEYVAREYGLRPKPSQVRAQRNTELATEVSSRFTNVRRWGERARARA